MAKIGVFLSCCVMILLTGCNFDHYSNQRPPDYGNAIWECDEYNIWFAVDLEKEDYYAPEGELQIKDTTYFCKFYFIHQTNQLHISVYPSEFANIPDASRNRNAVIGNIEGKCIFSDSSLIFTIDKVNGNIPGEIPPKLIFRKNVRQGTVSCLEEKH